MDLAGQKRAAGQYHRRCVETQPCLGNRATHAVGDAAIDLVLDAYDKANAVKPITGRRWSIEHLDDFWKAIWDYYHIEASPPPTAVLGKRTMPGADWFPGAKLNWAQHILRNEKPGVRPG